MNKYNFDNLDWRIKYYELLLERNLENIPKYDLPTGYRFVFYKDGDRDSWIDIEKSAKEFESYEQGLKAWNKYFQDQDIYKRMVFIETDDGKKVATGTAYYDIHGRDKSGDGWMHWISVRREYQGKGLSKPLISYVLNTMKNLGYVHAKIPTQTTTWLACKIYLDFGFTPLSQNAISSRNGWRIVKTLTNHPALEDFECIDINEILELKGQ